MKPRFKIANDERLFLGEKYLSNSHWLVSRDFGPWFSQRKLTPLVKLLDYTQGRYTKGIKHGLEEGKLPDFSTVIPKRDGFIELKCDPISAELRNGVEVWAYQYQTIDGEKTIYIGEQYTPLMMLGTCFMRDPLSPIIILNSDHLNGDLVGLIMPMRKKD